MIKQKKQNKFILFMCSIMLCFCSVFTLFNNSIGTTYALSPTEPIITEESYNYKSSTFADNIDIWLEEVSNIWILATSMNSAYTCSTDLAVGFPIDLTYQPIFYYYDINDGYTSLSLAVPTSSSLKIDNFRVDGVLTKFFYFPAPADGNQKLDVNNARRFFVVFKGTNGNYYTACSPVLTASYRAYQEGLAAGGGSTGPTYEDGVVDGRNDVISNPNDYDLYTQEQYDVNYNNGYNMGYGLGFTSGENQGKVIGTQTVINNPNNYDLYTQNQYDTYGQLQFNFGKNDVINNPNNYDLYTQNQYDDNFIDGYDKGLIESFGIFANSYITGNLIIKPSADSETYYYNETITNEDFNFSSGIITPKQSLIDKINGFWDYHNNNAGQFEWYRVANIDIRGLNFVYSKDIDISFVNFNNFISFSPQDTFYFKANFIQEGNIIPMDYYLLYFYDLVYRVEDNTAITTGYNFYNQSKDDYLVGKNIIGFNINLLESPPYNSYPPDVDFGSLSYGNDFVPVTNWLFSNNNIAFDLGYDKGYTDGTSSEVVTNAYDEGYTDGNRVGYQQGLSNGIANANDYTFFGLIGAVIDAPIQYLTSLFNFNILGFNMWAFFTSLITAVFVIWIIRLILGGK